MYLSEFQEELFGSAANEVQQAFYDSNTCGYLGVDRDESKFLAVLVLAFWKTLPIGTEKYHKVLLLVPPAHEKWVLAQVKTYAKMLLERFSECPELYHLVCQAIRHLQLGARILGMPEAPEHWVSFGFRSEDPIPAWMQSRLVQGDINDPQDS